jgi:hypothetical protein
VPGAEVARQGVCCGLDAVIARYDVTDPAASRVAGIVRGAGVQAVKGQFLEPAGLEAIAHGFFLQRIPDEQALRLQFPIYAALHQY